MKFSLFFAGSVVGIAHGVAAVEAAYCKHLCAGVDPVLRFCLPFVSVCGVIFCAAAVCAPALLAAPKRVSVSPIPAYIIGIMHDIAVTGSVRQCYSSADGYGFANIGFMVYI